LKYPGIKEDVYVSRFVPKPGIRLQLGLREQDVVVTIRPPANEAHYHSPKTDELFEAAVEFLSKRAEVKLVALPRNEKQAICLRKRWPELFSSGKMRIPEKVVDGLNLIWHSDLVISAGGTMNREAAALGVPVYSIFRGEIGAVDRYLSKAGRLVLIEGCEDLETKILLGRRERPAKPPRRRTAALSYIVERIIGIAESQRPFSDRIEVTTESKSNGEVRSQDATV
jgi:predicted glycosyltransferase